MQSNGQGSERAHSPAPFIHIDQVTRAYREGEVLRTVLQGASAQIAQAEFVAILGKSGSGKSTLLNLISGIDDVEAGRICIAGVNLTALDERQRTLFRRQKVGFIFQFFNLLPTLSVWENLTLPLELGGPLTAEGRSRAAALLDRVGLLDRRDTYPDRLSGGEQQRVAIARALVHDPALILADEPTGNLDEATGQRILALLDEMVRGAGKNLIMVTHSHEAARHADRVLVLREGLLHEESPEAMD